MNLTYERSRSCALLPSKALKDTFGDLLKNESSAVFIDASKSAVFGVTGLPIYMPIAEHIINDPSISRIVSGNTLITIGDTISAQNERGQIELDENAKSVIRASLESLSCGMGRIGEHGEQIIPLTSCRVGPHYDVNLLLGNRIGYRSPLITTPKAALDSFGRGSFRADASRQVLATRFDLFFEHNGEPANRQFYIYENDTQIFYSADASSNIKSAECRHFQNRTEIEYTTNCGLNILRTIFIMPQDDDMPEAVECQRVVIKDINGSERHIKVVFTGVFGLSSPESMTNDIVYASVTHEGGLIRDGDKVIAIAPSSYPAHLKWQKRFAMIFSDGAPMDEFSTDHNEFFGNGSIEHPQFGAHLSSRLSTKCVPFFAMAKSINVNGAGTIIDEFVGFTADRSPDLSKFEERLSNFICKYNDHAAVFAALENVKRFIGDYSSYLSVHSDDKLFESYVNSNLPFQVLYQSFVSRSFAWTQKAYREIGFREIQDMYASVYYMCAMGNSQLAKEMLSKWIANVYDLGYANHNFYESGQEPGVCSDDALWLVQAIYRYISLTNDTEFLKESFPTADGGTRTLIETMKAIVRYSGKISVGTHGFPLMDKADWNDTMKLDNDWINGKEKESLYKEQLRTAEKEIGAKFESNYSESVMNAFLLKIALDELAEMSDMINEDSTSIREDSADLKKRLINYAWKNDFFARAMINGHEGYEYLGAEGDGLSADPKVNGTYFLNSFSWSILADVASEEQIEIMLDRVLEHLWTDAGLKLCTPAALEKLASGTAAGHYYPGDRENGGIFKHAAMMAVTAMLRAAKSVKSRTLAARLVNTAYDMINKTLPYKAMVSPYILKGNPRFCTQYNNSDSGENCGPMLSGTASWLTLAIFEMLGINYDANGISLSPMLPIDSDGIKYTIKCQNTEFNISVEKNATFSRLDERTECYADGKALRLGEHLKFDKQKHDIKIIMRS